MIKENMGGTAFPRIDGIVKSSENIFDIHTTDGISVWDFYAAHADKLPEDADPKCLSLASGIALPKTAEELSQFMLKVGAWHKAIQADAMMEERSKRMKKP